MIDMQAVMETLVAHAVSAHGDDLDLICAYGSRARGEARPTSDLDIFYTPVDGEDPPVGRTFLIDGLLVDFWALRWETLEGFATGRLRGWAFAPGVVRHAQVLYARTEAQAKRLQELKDRIQALQEPESQSAMVDRALDAFAQVTAHLHSLQRAVEGGCATDVRASGWKLIEAAWECLALANQVTFERGFAKSLDAIERFAHRPDTMRELIATIATSRDFAEILRSAETLASETRCVLHELQSARPPRASVERVFLSAYPELRDQVGKLLTACELRDSVRAGFEAYRLQSEIVMMLGETEAGPAHKTVHLHHEAAARYTALGFPDLLAIPPTAMDELAKAATRLDQHLRSWLATQSVDLCEFATLDELRKALTES